MDRQSEERIAAIAGGHEARWGTIEAPSLSFQWSQARLEARHVLADVLDPSAGERPEVWLSRAPGDDDGAAGGWLQLALRWPSGHRLCFRAPAGDGALLEGLEERAVRGAVVGLDGLRQIVGALRELGLAITLAGGRPAPPAPPDGAEPVRDEAASGDLAALEAAGDWDGLVDALERRCAESGDPGERSDLLVRCALVHEEQLEQLEEAANCLERALDLDPTDQAALERLARICELTVDWERLVQVLLRRLDLVAAPPEQSALLCQLGVIYEEALGDWEGATTCFEKALVADGASAEALEALERLYSLSERWTELVEVLRRQADAAATPAEAAALRLRCAELLAHVLEDVEEARAEAEAALALEPDNEEARDLLGILE